ncbi:MULTISPECIES: TRAP transporter substrate-binding protein [Polaribacter]|uniref:C4-dicarboxylate ABC transporter substrate-binding protein n=1 Tax=Polaribacter sejongensis TaxID=985043 RepID=A0AAJ1VEX4_9FLAO|nr:MULTISPECIES: TRAP transporter substrate-binding protein [Polaribacter]AUC23616.1 C4-dicarboxylate ABC transporter substrate-binding protein [Polaribacter sejongensis]MDN3617834.1 TRAP transporter substrate-binding protein [Polaribacter undariae]UWD32157.1 TRAP transporter substrate-binding protein [Polaribacter undariae]
MINRNTVITAFLFVFLLSLSGCKTEKTVKVLKLAHALDTQHPVHKAMVILGERLKEKSDGKLIVNIYPSSQLGGERECLELLQIGSLDITKVSAAVLENFIPEYKVFSVPYMFRDKTHMFSVFDSEIGDNLLLKGEKFRLRGLTFYDAGSRSFYMKEKPVKSPADLKGKKIRVQKSNMAVAMVNDLGGSPTPISWGELYTALQQGVVDGAENNPPSFYTSKHYEVCKFFSLDEHTSVPDVLLIGTDTWGRFNEQEKGWLKEAVAESTIVQRKLWAASEKESLAAVKKAGVEVFYPDKVPFEEQTQGVLDMFADNEAMKSLILSIKNKQ